MILLSFLVIRAVSRISRTLNRRLKEDIFCLIPNLMRKAFNILSLRITFSEGFSLMCFTTLRKSPSTPGFFCFSFPLDFLELFP